MNDPERRSQWEVGFTSAAARQKRKLPDVIAEGLARLIGDMEKRGPIEELLPKGRRFSAPEKGGLILVP